MLNSKPDSHSTSFMPISPAERYAQAIESGQFMQDEAQAQAALKAAEAALHERGAEFDYGAASVRLAEAAAQLRTVQQIRKKFGH